MSSQQQAFEDWTRSKADHLEVEPSAEAKAKFLLGLDHNTRRRSFSAFKSIKWMAMAASLTGLIFFSVLYNKSLKQAGNSPAVLVLEDYIPGPSEAMPLLAEFQSQQQLLAICKSKRNTPSSNRY